MSLLIYTDFTKPTQTKRARPICVYLCESVAKKQIASLKFDELARTEPALQLFHCSAFRRTLGCVFRSDGGGSRCQMLADGVHQGLRAC